MRRASFATPGPSSWRRFALCYAAGVAGFLLCPDGSWPQAVAFCLLGLAAAATAWRVAPGARHDRAWRWMAAGVALNAIGTLVEMLLARLAHSDAFPSLADVFYLSIYPGIGIGLLLLVRRAPGPVLKTSILDSCTITAGAGLLSWIYLIHPLANNVELDLAGRAVSIAYPLADLLLLAMATRVLLVTSLRTVAHRLVFAAVALLLIGDTTWGVINQLGLATGPVSDRVLQVGYLTAYALVGSATLHPSARLAPEDDRPASPRLRPPMLAALTIAALTAPAVLAAQALGGRVIDGAAVALGSAVLFLLVITRMAGLLGQVEKQAALLRDLALVDELTGLANRRALMSDLVRSCEQTQRGDGRLALAVLDLDHFKQFNDLFGHVEGDRLLSSAARAWSERLRGSDLLARYGGEEFVVVMPGTDIASALAVLAGLREVTPAGVSFSGGLATWHPGDNCNSLIARADEALYLAKASGRDQVKLAARDGRPGVRSNRRPSESQPYR